MASWESEIPILFLQMKATHYNKLQLLRIHNAIPQRLYQTRASEARSVKFDVTLNETKNTKAF